MLKQNIQTIMPLLLLVGVLISALLVGWLFSGVNMATAIGNTNGSQSGGAIVHDYEKMDLDLDRDAVRPPPYVCGNVILNDINRQIDEHKKQIKFFQDQCSEGQTTGKGLFDNPLTVYQAPPLDPTVDADKQPVTKGIIWGLVKVRFPPDNRWFRVKDGGHAISLIKTLPPEYWTNA